MCNMADVRDTKKKHKKFLKLIESHVIRFWKLEVVDVSVGTHFVKQWPLMLKYQFFFTTFMASITSCNTTNYSLLTKLSSKIIFNDMFHIWNWQKVMLIWSFFFQFYNLLLHVNNSRSKFSYIDTCISEINKKFMPL